MKPHLLLADDNVPFVRLLEAYLDRAYFLSTVHTAKETLALLRNVLFHAALLDIGFPDMPKKEFVTKIAEIPARAKLIVLTSYDHDDIEEDIKLITPIAVLKKPACVNQITEVLAAVTGTHGEQRWQGR